MNPADCQPQLQKKYFRATWQALLPQLLPGVEMFAQAHDFPLTGDYERGIATARRQFGAATLADGKRIAFYEIEVAPEVQLQSNRVGLRSLIVKCIDEVSAHAVLAFFVQPGKSFYRLTYAARESRLGEGVKILTEQTAPRRFTYLLGAGESCRTAAERFGKLPGNTKISDLTEAFSVDKLNKDFFADFRKAFDVVVKDLLDRNTGWDRAAAERETQTLLSRLLFLYFIQRKGWLNRQRNYLIAIFNRYHADDADGTSFNEQFLKPFFVKLSDAEAFFPNLDLGDLPFLNGGLFDDETGSLTERGRMRVGNPAFRHVFDRLLEAYNFTVREDTPLDQEVAIDPEMLGKIFESLVLQLEQSDTGGKTSRHDTGSYYTPRPIVHYLCREGLRAWLEQFPPVGDAVRSLTSKLRDPQTLTPALSLSERESENRFHSPGTSRAPIHQDAPKVSPSPGGEGQGEGGRSATTIQSLVTSSPTTSDWPQRLEKLFTLDAADGLDDTERATLHELLTPDEARAVADRLDDFRACDPAVGSGAFLVGLLHELVNLHRLCETRSRGKDPAADIEWLYETKKRVIENVLYGVDLQQRAVEICKLRLWISLMVDYPLEVDPDNCALPDFRKALKKITPLPNLDFKIRRANSLIEQIRGHAVKFPQTAADSRDFNLSLNKLATAKHRFYEARKKKNKRLAQLDILEATAEMAKYEFSAAKLKYGLLPSDKDAERAAELDRAEAEMGKLQMQIAAARKRGERDKDGDIERLSRVFNDEAKPTFVWQLDFAEIFHRSGSAAAPAAAFRALAEGSARGDPADGATAAAPEGGRAPQLSTFNSQPSTSRSGFDLVLANPPYVRQEKIKELKPALQNAYVCFDGRADLYVYFYERAVKLLGHGGVISFISSNKFFRAGYGENLRKFLSGTTQLRNVIDFGDLPIFDATAYPCIVVAQYRSSAENRPVRTLNVTTEQELDGFVELARNRTTELPQGEFGKSVWQLQSSDILSLLAKLRAAGTSLGGLVTGKIYAGIKTGLNEAFMVDNETRKALIKEHKSSAELIKPFVKGKDVGKWVCEVGDRFIVYTPHGTEIENYPAIKNHLSKFKQDLERRALDQKWFELQQPQLAFTKEFQKAKIVYPNVALGCRFALDTGSYLDMTTFCICSSDLLLLAILNSSTMSFFFAHLGIQRRGGYQEFKTQYVKEFPIPAAPASERMAIEKLVEQCLAARGENCGAWEAEINARVARLYHLTPEEIQLVEEATQK